MVGKNVGATDGMIEGVEVELGLPDGTLLGCCEKLGCDVGSGVGKGVGLFVAPGMLGAGVGGNDGKTVG